MADQVSPATGSANGLPVLLSLAATAGPGTGRSAKIADRSSQEPTRPAVQAGSGSPAKAAERINNHLQQAGSDLRIEADQDTGRIIYKVVDPSTGQVVLQVPSAQVLAMAHSLQTIDKQAGASGVLLDEKS